MNDLEFVCRCVKADRQAWDEFFKKYSRLIYNYIYSILNLKGCKSLSQDQVNDIFQEIFLLLVKDNFKKLKSFKAKNGCSLASWLRQVVVNYSIDYIRRLKPNLEFSLEEETDNESKPLKDRLVCNASPVDETLITEEKLDQLKYCIDKLDTDDKYFIELHINQGLSLKDLKDLFGVSRAVVDTRKSRIIAKLTECFKSKGFMLDF